MTVKFRNPASPYFEDYYHIDKRVFFILVCLITFLLLFLKKSLVESRIAAFEILEESGNNLQFDVFNFIQYISIPVIYLYKFTVISFLLWLGSFTWGYRVSYAKVWQLVMFAECIFFLAEFAKVGWFVFISKDVDIWEVRAFYPLSLMGFFNYNSISGALHYPLKALNLFEIIYWMILAFGIQYLTKKRLDISIYIVLSFYVFWFLIWLGFYIIVYK
jgi:hypothetical protein